MKEFSPKLHQGMQRTNPFRDQRFLSQIMALLVLLDALGDEKPQPNSKKLLVAG